jgi:LPS-assembly protein
VQASVLSFLSEKGMINKIKYLFIWVAFLLFLHVLVSPSYSQSSPFPRVEAGEKPVRVQADRISYDQENASYTAEGRVEIQIGDQKITADRVTVNGRTNEAEAIGHVVLTQGEDVLSSERIKIDLDTTQGVIFKGTLFLKNQHFYLRGEEIERIGEDTYRIKGGSFTTCDGDWPAWRFTGQDTLVTLEDYAFVQGATFQLKKIPLLYSPYLVFPVKTKRQSGFLFPRASFSNTSGFELGNAFFWAISKNMDATFILDLATEKGAGEGIEYRYVRQKESFGKFYAYHAREMDSYREKRTEQLDRKPDRWEVELEHEEYFDPTFFAKTSLIGISDRQYLRDYGLTYGDRSSEQIYSFVSLTKNWEWYSLFGEARHTVDLRADDPTTLQYYPLVNLLGFRQPLLHTPLYYDFNTSYGYFWREEGTTGHKLDIYPRLSLPYKWNGIEVTPQFGVRETLYYSKDGTEESHSRELWDLKMTAAADLDRVFNTGWTSIPKLKHVLRPEIDYSYIPDVDQQQVPSYDFVIPKVNAITYSLTQRLIGKVVEGPDQSRYHEFVYFKLSQAYDFNNASQTNIPATESAKPFSVIREELRVTALQYLTVENISNYDIYQNRFQTFYASVALADSRGDGLNFEYQWVSGLQEQVNGILRVKILPSLTASFGTRYSVMDKQTLDTVYSFLYQHQCWSLDVSYSEKPAIAGQPAEKKIMFMFNLMGVTSVGSR